MKFGCTLLFSLFFVAQCAAQSEVTWKFSFNSKTSTFSASAEIGEGWHLYSTKKSVELGPIPTEFEFATEGIQLVGDIQEPLPIKAFDVNFEETLLYFEDQVLLTQEMKVNGAEKIDGTVTYMVCNESMCMPPIDVEFTIEVTDEK